MQRSMAIFGPSINVLRCRQSNPDNLETMTCDCGVKVRIPDDADRRSGLMPIT